MIKSYKIRLYPTSEQEQKMWQHIGACRFVWNYMLALQQSRYENGEKHLSRFDMIKCLTPLKREADKLWLKEIANTSLQIICTDLSKSYEMFFRKQGGYPKFKSRKKSKPNFPTRCNTLWFNGSVVNIEKIGKVKYKTDFEIPLGRGNKLTNPRISYHNGKWLLGFGTDCEIQTSVLTDKPMGIDLGVKETMTVAYGDESIVFHNINKSRRIRLLNKQMKHL